MKAIANTTIRLSLINIPVQVCQAVEKGDDISFSMASSKGEPVKRAYTADGTTILNDGELQKGIFEGDTFFPVDAEALEAINNATALPDLDVLEVIDREDLNKELYRANEIYYLQSAKKGGNINSYKLFVDVLTAENKALVTKWTARSRQKLMAIYAENGVLMATALTFWGNIREPDEAVRAHFAGKYSDKEYEMACSLIQSLSTPVPAVLNSAVDEALPMKRTLVENLLQGQKPEPVEAPEPADATSNLEDALAQALAEVA